MDGDWERRQNLRAFLMRSRARLRPTDVGLPAGTRRRVPGLRREEVAELAGVSPEWYRWFESGRPMGVSQRFVARLARALSLDASDETMLHILSFRELYQAGTASQLSDETDASLRFSQLDIAEARCQRSAHDGTLRAFSNLRHFLRKAASVSSFEDAASLAADTAQAILVPNCITVLCLNRSEPGLWDYAIGPKSNHWTGLHSRVAYDAHCVPLCHGGIGSSEYLLSVEELAEENTALNSFKRSEYEPTPYNYECAVEVWRDFNVALRARSCILVPMFEGVRFRGIMAVAWREPRNIAETDIDAAQTIAAITALTTK